VFTGWPRQLPGADPAAAFRWKHLESPFGPSLMVVSEAGGALIGFEALLRGSRLLVNPVREDIDPDPTETTSWALSYGDLELL
jgi:hypothetical protein